MNKNNPTECKKAEEIDETRIKFTTKKARGWIDVGGTRMNLVDIPGGWYGIKKLLGLLAGTETLRRVMFEAGNGERFTLSALEAGFLTRSSQGFIDAVDCYSEAGFGDFKVKEIDFDRGYALIFCKDSFEGWSLQANKEKAAESMCDYSRGVLLSFMQKLTKKGNLNCVETQCIGTGATECQYVIDEERRLVEKGFDLSSLGKSIRERAEELAESEEKFRLTFESAKDAFFWTDPQTGLVTNCNRAAELLLEKKKDEIIGFHQTKIHPPQKAEFYANMFRKHIEHKGWTEDEAEIITKSGKIKPVLITVTVTLIREKPMIQGIFRDVTERKQMEKELLKGEKLAAAVQIASEAAHEIKNPLAVIKSGLYYMGMILPEDKEAQKILSQMDAATQRATTYINDLLSFSRPPELKKTKFNINEMVKKALDELPVDMLSNIDVQQELASDLPDIPADFERLKQVVTNLVKNAAEAMEEVKNGKLKVKSEKEGKFVKFSVSDTGKGMIEKDLKHIFDPFFTTKGKGTGLGLAICQRIVETHKGKIEVESQVGKGTIFVVKLSVE